MAAITSDETVDITEEDVPKGEAPQEDIPQTGDCSTILWSVLALISGAALVLLLLTDRQKLQK